MAVTFENRQMAGAQLTSLKGDNLFGPRFDQSGHGFAVGDVIRESADETFTKARANTVANIGVGLAIVVSVISANAFSCIRIENGQDIAWASHGHGSTHGTTLYLSTSTAGEMQTTRPDQADGFAVVLGYVIDAGNIHWGQGPVYF